MATPAPEQTQAVAAHIRDVAEQSGTLIIDRYGIERWAAAVNHLIDVEQFDTARYALHQMRPAFPKAEFVQNLSVVLEHLPNPSELTPFCDNPGRDCQIAPRAGADTAILLFCGGGDTYRLGMPLNAFHRWAGSMPASLIYLRDFRDDFFLNGIESNAGGLDATLKFLRQTIADLKVRRTLCYGFSMGGFAALHYGLALQAQCILTLGAPVSLEPRFNLFLRWSRAARRLSDKYPNLRLNLIDEYAAATAPPRVSLVYGEHSWDDRIHAERMAKQPFAEARAVGNWAGHNPAIELIRCNEFTPMLQRFCDT